MLNDKLSLFYQKVNEAASTHGLNAKAVADVVLLEAFPETSTAANQEGADAMLRNGVIQFLTAYFKRAPKLDPDQLAFDIPEQFAPIVSKLKSGAHYVKELGQLVPVEMLIAQPAWLDDARKYKRRKGEETIAEAVVLDELYTAVTKA
ncbi:hypothetical protein NGM99_13910 [Mesorhizobium sp. RP14(2022)]|uniref:Uncharacterized protein n=1 Tax=Mesorhizobium liriopis TaxID=2953882 RepID=A0ABT1C7S8_9HYPH|nr:hypothetical protein [Mesorhizobium liriopis]MCO6050875.1 hypothetical protein [Mesorhizobium liriopis]